MAHATAPFQGPCPGPWGGAKGSNIIKSKLQSQFQKILNQTLCVSSQMKDIKHIRQVFHWAAWSSSEAGLVGTIAGRWVKNLFSEIQPDLVCELLT